MKTAVETIYDLFENHDERVFLDFLRENKTYLLNREQEQSKPTPTTKPQQDKFKVSSVEPNS
jgi:hypothetical protein